MKFACWLRLSNMRQIPTRSRRVPLRPGVERLEDRTTPSAGTLDTTFGSGGLVTGDFTLIRGSNAIVVEQSVGTNHNLVVATDAPDSTNSQGYSARLTRYNEDGTLDNSFDRTGVIALSSFFSQIDDMVALSSGKLLAVGEGVARAAGDNEDHLVGVVSRFLPDGQLDTSFGNGGTIVTDFRAGYKSVTMLGDGSFLVGGALTRLLANGAIDTHAGNVGNYSVGLLEHFSADGQLDTTFGNAVDYPGIAQIDLGRYGQGIGEIAIKSNGSIVTAVNGNGNYRTGPEGNFDAYVAQFTASGTLDANFNGQGWAQVIDPTAAQTNSSLNVLSLVLQPSGSIIVGGGRLTSGGSIYVARLTATGTPDTSFDGDGMLIVQPGTDQLNFLDHIVTQSDGNPLLVGRAIGASNAELDIGVMRITADGQIDTAFGPFGNGTVVTRMETLNPSLPNDLNNPAQNFGQDGIIDGSGRLVVAATTIDPSTLVTHFGLVRYELGLRSATTITTMGGSFPYDGQPHPAPGSVVGSNGTDLGAPTFSYSYTDDNGNVITQAGRPVEPGYYTVTASFAGNDNFLPSTKTMCVTIYYDSLTLTDLSKAFHAGRTIPIKIQLTDANGNNVSSSGIDLSAIRLERENADGSRTQVSLQDAGNSNPGNLFRYDSTIGGYIFNLSTKNLGAGTYDFFWMADGDPTEHCLRFWLD